MYTLTRTACSIALDNCILSSNSATSNVLSSLFRLTRSTDELVHHPHSLAAAVGGAVWISTLVDPPLNLLYCDTAASPQFREWEVEFTLRISDTAIVNNSAVCTGTCSAGGVAMSAGGKLIIARSSIVGNVASTFAGGLLLGGTSAGTASCLLSIEDSHIRGNSAQQAGAQVYNNCGGDVSIVNTDIDMDNSNNEVEFLLVFHFRFHSFSIVSTYCCVNRRCLCRWQVEFPSPIRRCSAL